ncbi:hypothetical protein [Thiothrix lacustris]|uniref:hypothetical protein n=1 Tax=Thiothrix lacustris TaxID=525917 RepID=UPI0027E4BFDD|nr:hypothetical protein [Thiothrix lacustris]WMP19292.1 hypothetical protein RCS87_09635 [Thiothrix lacustris]
MLRSIYSAEFSWLVFFLRNGVVVMGALIHADKHLVLNNRYALLGCIAVSSAGKIYKGRDLGLVGNQELESRVLIHVLPKAALCWPLDDMFQQIRSTCQQIREAWILEPLAYGQDKDFAYVVLKSPSSEVLQSLLSTNSDKPCYQGTRQRIDPLVKQDYLKAHIAPALFVCTADEGLYLLATALAPQVQALDKGISHRQFMPRKSLGQALMTGMLLSLFAIFTAVAGNTALDMGLIDKPSLLGAWKTESVPPSQPMELAALPSTNAASVLVRQHDQVMRTFSDDLVPLTKTDAQPLPASLKSSTVALVRAPSPKSEFGTQKKATVTASTPKPAPTSRNADRRQATKVLKQPEVSTPPNQLGIDELISQAYAMLNTGNLGGQNGALYFVRQLRSQSASHPQVTRLGQEITAAYLRQVRGNLQTGRLTAAARVLPMTRQLIQEFNLPNLNPAQQVLEDKIVELNGH